jgi:hypothetical protein
MIETSDWVHVMGKLMFLVFVNHPFSHSSSPFEDTATSDENEKKLLRVNLQVQRCWAEMMVYCKLLRTIGIENIA